MNKIKKKQIKINKLPKYYIDFIDFIDYICSSFELN